MTVNRDSGSRPWCLVEAERFDLALGESQIDRIGFHYFLAAGSEGCVMQDFLRGRSLPRIAILAQAGPLAGDLAACLSGQFTVERATSLREARSALSRGCRALLLAGSPAEFSDSVGALVEQALGCGCRVLMLGSGRLDWDASRFGEIQILPEWPSPQEVLAALVGLRDEHQAGA